MSALGAVEYSTKPLNPETWDDFAALVDAHNGVWGGCWCMGFHPEGFSRSHDPGGNRQAKRDRVLAGTVRQVLVYDGDSCVGWCQYGTPDEVSNIKNRKKYDETVDRPPQRGAYLRTGPEELYTAFGFVRVRQIAKWRWVMRVDVPPA